MPEAASPGRRERNKQQKLERIVAAASELFAVRGVDDVTTQEIAERADIGTGTLFLYAKTKGELLLLVQNEHYARALDEGQAAAAATPEIVDAVIALMRPVVECNRVQVDNGRTYLREMVFGDAEEQQHARALEIVAQTEQALITIIARDRPAEDAAVAARIISAVVFVAMAAPPNVALSVEELVRDIRRQVSALLVH